MGWTENEATPRSEGEADRVETILLVEDEPEVRRVVSLTLELQGYRVLAAANVEQALRLAAANEDSLDLLLSDVVLPGLSGPKLHEVLCSTQPGLRVLFMSGYGHEVLTSHGLDSSDAHFLSKPFSSATLSRKLRQLLRTSPHRQQEA